EGKRLLGLVTRQSLAIKPDTLASLNVWEISRFLATMTVERIMVKADQVITITPERTAERAARIMTEHKIGCLVVVEDAHNPIVVGILTETDLLAAFQEMLGLPGAGVRVTMRVPNRKGEFAKIAGAVAAQGWGIIGVASYRSRRAPDRYDVVLKITDVTPDEVKVVLGQIPDQEMIDIRTVV
ncbi:MAG: CBS domain-containing protein, partial [Caldilineales bacterium]|nr:CBS domain-containing protein [Caldilineales bacterium]